MMKKYKSIILSLIFYILCAAVFLVMTYGGTALGISGTNSSILIQIIFIVAAPVFCTLGLVFALKSCKQTELLWLGVFLKTIGIVALIGIGIFYALVGAIQYSYSNG